MSVIGTDGYPDLEDEDHYDRRAWSLDGCSSASWLIEGQDRRAWAAASAVHWNHYGEPLKATSVRVLTCRFETVEDGDGYWIAEESTDGVPVLEF